MTCKRAKNLQNVKYILSLGSNCGKRKDSLQEAFVELEKIGHIIRRSSVYETEAVGFTEQNSFLNTVCFFEIFCRPFRLLWKLKAIECKLGRVRSFRWGPRKIDIDIIDWDGEAVQTDMLTIPHKEMEKRNFVLLPLRELEPAYRSRAGKPIEALIEDCKDQGRIKLFADK